MARSTPAAKFVRNSVTPVPHYRGHSDTEILLEACEAWGVERTLPHLIGMFAFALVERDKRRLWLVRDRMGIKPLYWTRWGERHCFRL